MKNAKTKIVSSALICLFALAALNLYISNRGFCEEWTVEMLSVESGKGEGSGWASCEIFYRTKIVSFRLALVNRDSVAHDVKLTLTAQDELGVPFGFNFRVVSISAGAAVQEYLSVAVPKWAVVGLATARASALRVSDGVPCCPEVADSFWIVGGLPPSTGYLAVRTFTTRSVEFDGVGVQVGAVSYTSPFAVEIEAGVYAVKVEVKFGRLENDVLYVYDFRCWEDGSTANPRTVDVPQGESVTVTAYYLRYRSKYQPI